MDDFIIIYSRRSGKSLQERKNFLAMAQIPASQLANHEWMTRDLTFRQQRRKMGSATAQMVNPDRSIYQDHAQLWRARRRGARRARGSVPPNSANLRLADSAIRASSPARTRAVFSTIPDSRDASLRSLSSIFNVDLICINMHELLHTSQGWVVPPNQAETMFNAVREKGLPCAYIAFEGEQHGFRRAQNIKRALEAELFFYSKVFGFPLAEQIEPVVIENSQ